MATASLGPAYRRLWSATALANLGDGIRQAALPLLAITVTTNPLLVAGVAVAGQLPWLLFGLIAGAIVDRVDRRRLVAVVDIVRVALLAVLVAAIAADMAGLALIYLVAFGCGIGETLRDTAASTLLPPLVSRDDLDRANGRLVNAEIAGNELIGPPLGSYLTGVALMLPFAVNGGALAIAVVLILMLPTLFAPRRAPSGRLLAETGAGLRWLAGHRRLRTLTGLASLFVFTDSAWFAVLVLYVTDVLALPAAGYGLLLAAGAVGGLAGGASAARLGRVWGPGRTLAGALMVAAVGQLLLGLTSSTPVTAVGLVVGSFAFGVWNVISLTQRQKLTPDEMLGRVTSTARTTTMVASLVGALAGGVVASVFGLHAAVLFGVPLLVGAAVVCVVTFRS
ncbi:MFS transporter [Kibdelosporangium persicum]|uniref:Transmembrane secretion effector n=1 Tax=Kibdelosporangium persicum TaxID=2698649 RepID=A0ABX2F244_9PSEU|nr:MFS transporter [Kibdelosporangium persicum]NRN65380.1 Transmembrane secretion effector [Kibdelosporangium persicum]